MESGGKGRRNLKVLMKTCSCNSGDKALWYSESRRLNTFVELNMLLADIGAMNWKEEGNLLWVELNMLLVDVNMMNSRKAGE